MQVSIPLTQAQIDIANDPHRVKVVLAGRGWGKSTLLYAVLTMIGLTSRGKSAVIMPIQSQAKDFFRDMSDGENFESLTDGEPILWPYPLITWKGTKHRCEFRSFERPKRLRGGRWTGGVVACDEANDLSGDEISKIILPKMSTGDSQLYITSTITHHNWLWDLAQKGLGNDPLVKAWIFPSPTGIAFQGPKGKQRLADLRSITPKHIWDSEYLCIPGEDNSTAFPYFKQCIVDADPPTVRQPGRAYIAGLDLGRTRDHTFLTILDDTGLLVHAEEFELGQTHELMAQRVGARARYWDCSVVIDSTGAGGSGGTRLGSDSHVEVYRQHVNSLREFYWSPNSESQSKRDIISNLMLMTEQKRLRVPKKFQTVISQMQGYRVLQARGSKTTFGCREGHDDGVASLAMAAWGLHRRWFSSTGPSRDPDSYQPVRQF